MVSVNLQNNFIAEANWNAFFQTGFIKSES